MTINEKDILKIRRHRYFNEIYDINKTIISIIFKYTQKQMLYANKIAKSTELLLLLCIETGKYKINTDFKNNKVSITNKMAYELADKNNKKHYIAFHNHPNNSSFSLDDIDMMLKYENITMIILTTNDCKYNAALYKTKNFKVIHNLISKTYEFF